MHEEKKNPLQGILSAISCGTSKANDWADCSARVDIVHPASSLKFLWSLATGLVYGRVFLTLSKRSSVKEASRSRLVWPPHKIMSAVFRSPGWSRTSLPPARKIPRALKWSWSRAFHVLLLESLFCSCLTWIFLQFKHILSCPVWQEYKDATSFAAVCYALWIYHVPFPSSCLKDEEPQVSHFFCPES